MHCLTCIFKALYISAILFKLQIRKIGKILKMTSEMFNREISDSLLQLERKN
jgi:hypothetical protein